MNNVMSQVWYKVRDHALDKVDDQVLYEVFILTEDQVLDQVRGQP